MQYVILALVAVLTGCATIGMPSQPSKPLAQHTEAELCHFYHKNPTPALRSEIDDRLGFSEAQWQVIDANKIRIGMSGAAMICSWGLPTPYGDINRYVGQRGNDAQWVYRNCKRCEATYVYTDDGIVTSWSQ